LLMIPPRHPAQALLTIAHEYKKRVDFHTD
jgi:hypothetical protein